MLYRCNKEVLEIPYLIIFLLEEERIRALKLPNKLLDRYYIIKLLIAIIKEEI